tara:strand:+ start:322 stop:489 length:168 start_codon:yes stop_codon:yes gene_type:complete
MKHNNKKLDRDVDAIKKGKASPPSFLSIDFVHVGPDSSKVTKNIMEKKVTEWLGG